MTGIFTVSKQPPHADYRYITDTAGNQLHVDGHDAETIIIRSLYDAVNINSGHSHPLTLESARTLHRLLAQRIQAAEDYGRQGDEA